MGRMTFQKRQKEMKRQEKRQMKAERRVLRKLAKDVEGKSTVRTGEVAAPPEQDR